MDIKNYMQQVGIQARQASRAIARADSNAKNAALLTIADLLEQNREQIKAANDIDLKAGKENGLDDALLDRLI